MASVQSRRSESRDEAILRLADQAAQRGVEIYRTPDGRHWATSISSPGDLHLVTGLSCDCRGFFRHQRCTHHSALLDYLGWLPGAPEPPPSTSWVAEVPCRNCGGHGWGYGTVAGGRMDRVTWWR